MVAAITDIIIVALLAGSVAYGFIVHRRVQRLMMALQDIEPLVREFSVAVDRSADSVRQMTENLDDVSEAMDYGEPAYAAEDEEEPVFATRRYSQPRRRPGVQVVRDKQDLVRRFFETSQTESRA